MLKIALLSILTLASGTFLTLQSSQAAAGGAYATGKCYESDFAGLTRLDAVVDRGVDGDTVRVIISGKSFPIRYLGIDTPETHFQGKSQGYWGDKAAEAMAKLLPPGTQVTLEFDGEHCDRFGRILAHVWRGDINTNRQQVATGMAVNYCIFPNVLHCAEYGALVKNSMRYRRGMFSDSTVMIPYEWRHAQTGNRYDKFVGNLETLQVYAPTALDTIPVWARIFFMQKCEIKAPFQYAGDGDSALGRCDKN